MARQGVRSDTAPREIPRRWPIPFTGGDRLPRPPMSSGGWEIPRRRRGGHPRPRRSTDHRVRGAGTFRGCSTSRVSRVSRRAFDRLANGTMPHESPRKHLSGTALVGAAALSLLLSAATSPSAAQNVRPDQPLSTAEIARRVTDSVVTIHTASGHGSGVIVDPTGIVVTNLHVIENETDLEVVLANGDIYDDIAVVDLDERRDLVVLKLKAYNLVPAAMGDSDDIRVGDSVVLVGSPEGFDSTVSEGVISAMRDTGAGYSVIQTSAPASPGSSGGGMFNAYAELIGIVTSQARQGQNLNFAVPFNYARGLLSTEPTMTLSDLTERLTTSASSRVAESTSSSTGISSADADRFNDLMQAISADEDLHEFVEFRDAGDGLWLFFYKDGDHVPEILGYVELLEDGFDRAMVVLQSQQLPSPESPWTSRQLVSLLQLSFNWNFAKLVADSDGSLGTMLELELRTTDKYSLIIGAYSVGEAADDVAGMMNAPETSGSSTMAPALTEAPAARTASVDLLDHAVRYDPGEWSEIPPLNDDVLLQLEHSSKEVWISLITERGEIPVEAMVRLIRQNMVVAGAQDVEGIRSGKRLVGGIELGYSETLATVEGVPFIYLAHVFSSERGTIQILGWTTRNLYTEHKATIERFVAGFHLP
ncbi:MAG: trypsin-like serine protease [Holophagales bacterium]|nr:trypsin-like serine protease [Holophagales bacterium]MYH26419.1 trypsin-like serine protease [Holophagales bacterium]